MGSSNIDPFSLWLAREANLVVLDKFFANNLRDQLLSEMKHSSRQLVPSIWNKLNILNWLMMHISYMLARFLTSMLVHNKERDVI